MSQSIHTWWPLPSHPKCKPVLKSCFLAPPGAQGSQSLWSRLCGRVSTHTTPPGYMCPTQIRSARLPHTLPGTPIHTHTNTRAHLGVAHPPRSRALFSSGRGRARGYTAAGCPAARRGSTCCAPSGWCRRGAAAGSARCGAGSRSSRRSWCSAPTPRPPSCSAGRGDTVRRCRCHG